MSQEYLDNLLNTINQYGDASKITHSYFGLSQTVILEGSVYINNIDFFRDPNLKRNKIKVIGSLQLENLVINELTHFPESCSNLIMDNCQMNVVNSVNKIKLENFQAQHCFFKDFVFIDSLNNNSPIRDFRIMNDSKVNSFKGIENKNISQFIISNCENIDCIDYLPKIFLKLNINKTKIDKISHCINKNHHIEYDEKSFNFYDNALKLEELVLIFKKLNVSIDEDRLNKILLTQNERIKLRSIMKNL